MGLMESKTKLSDVETLNHPDTKSIVENKIYALSGEQKLARSAVVENLTNLNLSNYNENESIQNSPFNSECPLKPVKLDFTALQNENPIQRRKRIMSGDRRTSYVMKLGSLRKAQLEREVNYINQSSKLCGEETDKILPNKVCNSFIYSDPTTNFNKMKSSCIRSEFNQGEDSSLQICEDSNITVVKKYDSNLEKTNNEHLTHNTVLEENNIMQSKNPEIVTIPQDSNAELDSWTDIVKTLKDKNKNGIRTVSLPNELRRFSTSYNPEHVFNKFAQNEKSESILFPSSNEIHGKLITFKEVTKPDTCDSIEKTANNIHVQNNESCKTNSDKRPKIFNIFALPVGFFSSCLNGGSSTSKSSDIQSNKSVMNPLGSSVEINLKSEHKDNRINSDYKIKSCNLDVVDNNLINVVSDNDEKSSSIGVSKCSNPSATYFSYRRVKTLFQKRIAEIEKEENSKKMTKNNYYKELEELGRGQWQDGVWIPFGNAKNLKEIYE